MTLRRITAVCTECKSLTTHEQPATRHVVHLLLSLVTLGLWIVVWIVCVARNDHRKQCTVCGNSTGAPSG